MASDASTKGSKAVVPEADAIDQLLAAGKCKQAVELAKERHKALRSPESERQLVSAYLARIGQFQSKGMAKDADTLIALVQQRFPAYQGQLVTLKIRAAAGSGRIDELVAPLARPTTPPDVRAAIETAIRQSLVDLPTLAASAALPADHALRVAAGAIHRAFEAVTAGPTDEAALALPEVSFRSPLAGWKLLVRAIGAFYRRDDAACRRALEGIAADAAVHRLVPVLLGMIDRTLPATGVAGALQARVAADDAPLRQSLTAVEQALDGYDSRQLPHAIRTAMRLCAASHPDRCDRLRQHIAAACESSEVPLELVRPSLPPPRADAYFWRLMARESETIGEPDYAAVFWERFLAHAVAERLFAPDGLEAAQVYRRAATLLGTLPPGELAEFAEDVELMDLLVPYYDDQPPEIAALAPKSEQPLRALVLSPGALFGRAVDCQPDAETFKAWWAWSGAADLPDKVREDIAKRWHQGRPGDAEPLLHLSTMAEARNALTTSLNHLVAAEAIDPLNPAVRRARLRLTVAIMLRHFRDKKAHLVEKDLETLATLPGMRDGDRAACLAAMRCAWLTLKKGDPAAEAEEVAAVARQMGPLAGRALLNSVAEMAKVPRGHEWQGLAPAPVPPDARDVARAEARLITVALDVGLRIVRPIEWNGLIAHVLRERPCPLTVAEVLAIGEAALRRPHFPQAYEASAAGLSLASAAGRGGEARFLLLRAGSLNAWWGRPRATQCLRAALELARQAHDADLIQQVLAAIDLHPHARGALADSRSGEPISDELLADVLKSEREADAFPTGMTEADKYLVLTERTRPRGSIFDGFDDGGYDDDDDDEDDDDDGFDDDGPDGVPDIDMGFDPEAVMNHLSPDLVQQLQDAVKKLGRFPTPAEMTKLDPKLMMALLMALAKSGVDTAGKHQPPPHGQGRGGRRRGRSGRQGRRRR
jgi:hypothetical protein